MSRFSAEEAMRPFVSRTVTAATLLAAGLLTAPAHAASNQFVIVVSEGLSPQVIELGNAYLRKADQDPDEKTAFDNLTATGKKSTVTPTAVADLKGFLETADNNGYRTGFVTTGDIADDASLFYNLPADPRVSLSGPDAKYDFIAGGGRAKLPADTAKRIKDAGGTYLPNEDSLSEEIIGRVLAPQAEGDLDFAIDRDPSVQAGLTELAVLGIDTMGAGDYPFVLIVHDTLTKKAIETKDSPGLVEQFRELNSIVADAASRREDNPNFKAAFLFTGGLKAPHFNTTVAEEQQKSLETLSNLMLSFAGAGRKLEGADNDALTAFVDPVEGLYRNWSLPADVKQKIIAGDLAPEAALRASYEPLLKLSYDGPAEPPVAY
ncbi:hypothetical protein EON80_18535, partial [bacterium]